jgi:Peptidase family S41
MSRFAPPMLAPALLASLFISAALVAQAPTPRPAPNAAEWRADLDFLEREMPIRHRNLYHHTTPAAFHREFAAIRALIPHGSRAEIVTAFMRLGTMVHDAHTGISPDTPALAFENLPVAFYLYEDGLFIQSADPAHASLLGARVLRIGRLSADSAIDAAATVTDASNPMTVAAFVPFRLAHPDMLYALRVTERADRTTLVLDRNGTRDTVTLQSLGRDSTGAPVIGGTWYWPGPRPGVPWLDSRDRSAEKTALWLQHPDSIGWSRYLGETRTLYVQCNQIGDPPQESFDDFFARVLKRADSSDVERLVLDLRQNGGGNNELLDAAMPYFVRSTIAQTRGRFFVITGRLTQSAAQNLVNRLELHTRAIFVGEPTGESPNMYGDAVRFSLPHSKLRVLLSSLWWQDMGPRDDRQWTGPYLAARLTSADYRANRDPALETILAWKVDERLGAVLTAASRDGDSSALATRYRAFTRDSLHRYTDVSGTMYFLSWSLHRAAAQKSGADAVRLRNAAIVALQLNVADHAKSARAHSELAAALAGSGRAAEALREAHAALAIDAHDAEARAIVVSGGAPRVG